ncbi:MAG: hypothetical protein LQ347_004359 [Umbilicaria vellea]|nr:MAG: hypothetical protein LQ347_004359 [Umbilicaria vellea]
MSRSLKHAWLRLPQSVRVKTYVFLKRIGNYVYGSNTVMPGAVTRLPFNLYLKFGCFGVQEGVSRGIDAAHGNQARAMDLLERHTQVPTPRTIDWICDAKRSFLLMTRLPGVPLGSVMYRMSDAEIFQLVEDLRRCLWQMRGIPNPYGPQSTICSAHGQGCFDFRINNSTRQECVKFKSEVEFNDYLLTDVPENEHAKAMPVLSTPHRICFTHGDLNARNILIDRGRLSGIVDWENAGWFPEYWEYTKIHYINRWTNRYLHDVVERLFPDHTKERENEYFLWQWVRPFG